MSAQTKKKSRTPARTRAHRKAVTQLRKDIAAVVATPPVQQPVPMPQPIAPIVPVVAGVALPFASVLPDPFGIARDIALAGAAALDRFPDVADAMGIDQTDVNRAAFMYREMRRVELARMSPPHQHEVDLALWAQQA